MKVYQAIAEVTAALAIEGIAKDRKNDQQGYKFRGIDDVYNALAPMIAKAKLCILPNVLERQVVERTSAKGSALFYVTVKVDFAFVAAEDDSSHHVITYGEAMDSGDKATNKAMSAAYKYACMQAFCIPTEGDNDADGKTHEVKADEKPKGMTHKPTDGAMEALDDKARSMLVDLAATMNEYIADGDIKGALDLLERAGIDNEQKTALWTLFDSKARSAMKRMKQEIAMRAIPADALSTQA